MSAWIRGLDTAARTKSGETVTPDRAMRLAAMWSSVNLLSSIVSNLPVDVFRGSSKVPVTPPQFVSAPSGIVTRREWVYQGMVSLLLRGNAYGFVLERDAVLRPRRVEWLNPDSVRVQQSSSLSDPTYMVGEEPVSAVDIIHMKGFLQPGSAVGLSPVAYHAEAIGVGLAAQRFGAQWFGDGAHPTALFQNTKRTMDAQQAAVVKSRIKAAFEGNREPLTLGADWTYTPLQVSANESQFIESMGYTDAQIARLYGPGVAEILGYGSSGSTLTYSNRVDRSLDLLTYSVATWVNKFEDMLTASIAQPQTAKFNVNALMRMDPKARHEMYKIDREIGLYSIDELRDFEDQPPLPDGQGADYAPSNTKPAPQPAPGGPDANQ